MSDALTRDVGKTSDDIEDLIAEYQDARGPQPNISYIAFTATPRNVTLERFGAKGAGRAAAAVPPLFDAPGHRGGVHSGRAPELHDLWSDPLKVVQIC